MKKRKNDKKQKKSMLLLLILLGISIGFALLSTTLKINGTASIKSNTWDIHWENVVPNQQSTITAETPTISNDGTTVTYDVELALPGDFYEFTVDAKNDGSVNGKIDDIRHTVKEVTIVEGEEVETTATLPNYILYTIYYDETTTAPVSGDILEAGETQTYKVRIEYDPLSEVLPEAGKVYRITDEIDYVQTKDRGSRNIEDIIDEIEANPNAYRNPDQDPTNEDIGLDENGNVINLDWWVSLGEYGEKDYYKMDDENEIVLGKDRCDGDDSSYGCITPATSDTQVVNGEVITPIPAYIMLAGENEFYPVTTIEYVFGDTNYREVNDITKMPHLPKTVTTIGTLLFYGTPLDCTVVIPKQVKTIGGGAFYLLGNGEINLEFETGSQLENINNHAFENSGLSGNLVLPQTVSYIGHESFRSNNLTSVTFPSNTTYFDQNSEYPSFDSSVVISHQY